jgi:hypothetical protein
VRGDDLPRLLVLDDREGLVRSFPGVASTRELARRLDPSELLDPEVVPADDAVGGMLGAPP